MRRALRRLPHSVFHHPLVPPTPLSRELLPSATAAKPASIPTLDEISINLPPIHGQKQPRIHKFDLKSLETTVRAHHEANAAAALGGSPLRPHAIASVEVELAFSGPAGGLEDPDPELQAHHASKRLPSERLPSERLPGERLPGDRLPFRPPRYEPSRYESLPSESLPSERLPFKVTYVPAREAAAPRFTIRPLIERRKAKRPGDGASAYLRAHEGTGDELEAYPELVSPEGEWDGLEERLTRTPIHETNKTDERHASPDLTAYKPARPDAGPVVNYPKKTVAQDPHQEVEGLDGFRVMEAPWDRFIPREPQQRGEERFEAEIQAFAKFMRPTRREVRATQQLINEVLHIVREAIPTCSITLQGSRVTGLDEPLSDVNLVVTPTELLMAPKNDVYIYKWKKRASNPKPILDRLAKQVHGIFRTHSRFARLGQRTPDYPELLLQDQRTGLLVRLVCGEATRAHEVTKYLKEANPQVQPLLLVLRHALLVRNWDYNVESWTAARSSLGTYPLLVMILAALNLSQAHYRRQLLGSQLLHVLGFWGSADLEQNGFAADPPRVFAKSAKKKRATVEDAPVDPFSAGIELIAHGHWAAEHGVAPKRQRFPSNLLCLQDPSHPYRDLGATTDFSPRLLDWIRSTRIALSDEVQQWSDRAAGKGTEERLRGRHIMGALFDREKVHEAHAELIAARRRLAAACEDS